MAGLPVPGIHGGRALNQGNVKMGMGRAVAGIALGALLAAVAPIVLLSEVFSLIPVVLLPSIALVALYRWAGRGPALFSALLMVGVDFIFMGPELMFAALLASIVPPLVLLGLEKRPFFQQVTGSIAAFGAGVFAAVGVLYLSFGGNMIERALSQVPVVTRMLPVENLAPVMEVMGKMLGRTLSLEDFYAVYDALIAQLIPQYQLRLPEYILSGALISALVCAWLSNRMRVGRGKAAPGCFMPLREWALPASTTGGLLLMLVVSGVLWLAGMKSAHTVFCAVYGIAVVAFCTQMLASMARRMHRSPLPIGRRRAMLVITLVLCFLGASTVAAVFGCASAIIGSRGMLAQRMQNRDNDGRFGGGE